CIRHPECPGSLSYQEGRDDRSLLFYPCSVSCRFRSLLFTVSGNEPPECQQFCHLFNPGITSKACDYRCLTSISSLYQPSGSQQSSWQLLPYCRQTSSVP